MDRLTHQADPFGLLPVGAEVEAEPAAMVAAAAELEQRQTWRVRHWCCWTRRIARAAAPRWQSGYRSFLHPY